LPPSSLAKIALRWTTPGKRKYGRFKETWRRTVERELNEKRLTLETASRMAAYRDNWRYPASPQAPDGTNED